MQPGQQQQEWSLAADLAQNPAQGTVQAPQQQQPQPVQPMQAPQQPAPATSDAPALPSFAPHAAPSGSNGAPPGPFGMPVDANPTVQLPAPAAPGGPPTMPPSVKLQLPRRHGERVTGLLRDGGPKGYSPYGLVVELGGGANAAGAINPATAAPPTAPPPQPNARPDARTAMERQLADAGWGGGGAATQQPQPQPHARGHPPMPGGVLPPVYAGPVRPEAESDYGLLTELRGDDMLGADTRGPSGQDTFKDFGLAAEVARRQGRTTGAGLRPRKRLAASGRPAELGFKPAGDGVFDASSRPSVRDPFALADEALRNPAVPFEPHVAPDQEMPEGRVPIKVPPEGGAATDAVLGDGGPYGIVYDLGGEEAFYAQLRAQEEAAALAAGADGVVQSATVEPTEDDKRRMLQHVMDWQPAGARFEYNEETGTLEAKAEGTYPFDRKARAFLEDPTSGKFYRTDKPGLWKRLRRRFRRKNPKEKKREEFWEPKIKGFRRCQQLWWAGFAGFFSIFGLFCQGVIGGFAIMNFYLTYILFAIGQESYLQYYSALATPFARLYYAGIMFSLIAVTARLCREALRDYQPPELRLRWVSTIQVATTSAAYVATVLITPLDDHLSYEYNRDHFFWRLPKPSDWDWRIVLWNVGNILRSVFLGISFVLLCYQYGLYCFNGIVRNETRNRIGLILEPRLIFDTSLAMYPQATPPRDFSARTRSPEALQPTGGLGIGAVSVEGMDSSRPGSAGSRPRTPPVSSAAATAAAAAAAISKTSTRRTRFADEVEAQDAHEAPRDQGAHD